MNRRLLQLSLPSSVVAFVAFCSVLLPLGAGSKAFAQGCPLPVVGPGGGAPCLQPISPLLTCVQPNLDGSFTAQWGYESLNSLCCPAYEIPIRTEGIGEDVRANFFNPAPIDRGQTVFFEPGLNPNAFSTTWDGTPLTWTLRYFTLVPPFFFAEASVTAVATGSAPFCSTDCLGDPNGNAEIDRCGVCDGDGTSCLECEDFEITAVQFSLDSIAQEQDALVQRALYQHRRIAGDSPSQRRFARRVRTESAQLAGENWITTWTLPGVIQTCANSEFCVTASTGPLLDPYVQNATRLRDLTLQVTNRIARRAQTAEQRRRGRGLRNQAENLLTEGLATVAMVPVEISSCS